MASQSPQRTRKTLQPQVQAVQHQHSGPAQIHREHSMSPNLRQRYVRTQSMPIVPGAGIDAPESPSQQQSPLQSQPQSSSQTQPQQVSSQQAQGAQPQFGYPRPIPLTRPQFLQHSQSEKWAMTDDLQADIDRADLLQQQQQQQQVSANAKPSPPAPAPGTAGVAYAGGAASAGFISHIKTHSGGNVSQEVVVAEAQTMVNTVPGRRRSSNEQVAHRASPLSYALRKTANTSPAYPSMPSPRSLKNRTPDRSLPVQEEPDEHDHEHLQALPPSPAPSSDVNLPKDTVKTDRDAEGTLVDLADDDDTQAPSAQRRHTGDSTEGSGEGSGTPRSAANPVFKQSTHPHGIQQMFDPHGALVNGSKVFNPNEFQQTLRKLQGEAASASLPANGVSGIPPLAQVQPQHFASLPPIPPFSRAEYSRNESRGSYPNWMLDYYHNYPEDMEFLDEAGAAYMQQFMPPGSSSGSLPHSIHARPDAPIPPTPHSQTSAPTPFQRNALAYMQHLQQQHQQQDSVSQENGAAQNGQKMFNPPMTPATPSGTPYPYPFSHVRRGLVHPPPSIPRGPSSVYDPHVVQEQLRLQMQMYALNNQNAAASANGSFQNGSNNQSNNVYLQNLYNQGLETDSTLSPASTPFPGMGPSYHPFNAFLNQTRAFARARNAGGVFVPGAMPGEEGRVTSASHRSSPSHFPVPMPPLPNGTSCSRGRSRGVVDEKEGTGTMRARKGGSGAKKSRLKVEMSRGRDMEPPSRVASTQPRDTSPEESSSGEETAGEHDYHEKPEPVARSSSRASRVELEDDLEEMRKGVLTEDEDNGEWVDEDDEDEQELLDLEFHPTYVLNPDKRRKKWDQRWDELVRAFQALDRETDSTMILLASPSHSTQLHSISSRSMRRDPALLRSPSYLKVKSSFSSLASHRRRTRTPHLSLLERYYAASTSLSSSSAGSASDSDNPDFQNRNEREADLKSMLRAALGSLGELRRLYEVREARWREEERRMREERVSMEMLMKQAFGDAGTATGMGELGFGPHGIGYEFGLGFPHM